MTALVERPPAPPPERDTARRRAPLEIAAHAPVLTSRVAALVGVLALLDVLGPHRLRHLSVAAVPLPLPALSAGAAATVVVSGLLLLRIAAGLRRRKRAEWRLAVVASAAVLVADLVRDERRPVEAALAAVLLALLLLTRDRFTAVADPHSRWFAVRIGLQVVGSGFVLGVLFLSLPWAGATSMSFADRCVEVLEALVGFSTSHDLGDRRFTDLFLVLMPVFGLGGLLAAVLFAVRPAQPCSELAADDEQQLRTVLARHGERDSLGYFALRRDKSVVWSASGKAAVTYRVVCGVALISGDPIGDPEAWPGALDAYRELVDRHGWTPAAMGGSELGATIYSRDLGLRALELGDEAVLHVDRFSLDGRAVRRIRQACGRVARAGYVTQVRRIRDLSADELAELHAAAEAWRRDPVERGYSMALSRLGDTLDGACVVVTARREGVLHGLLHFVPWGERGASLDLMRRSRECDNGLNEFMIAAMMQTAASLGIERVSMNFAVFRDVLERGARIGAGPVLRLWRRTLVFASRWWQIQTLYFFNSRFQPEWVPRYLSYPAARDLPRITVAALQAEAFLVPPRVVRTLLGRP